MKCPTCGSDSEVIKVRNYGRLVWRRHLCSQCKAKFTSYQRPKTPKAKKDLPVGHPPAAIPKILDTH